MARSANSFEDPAGVKDTYEWPINHSDEESFGKERNISHSAPTGEVGLIRQQGADSPMRMEISGTIFHEAQLQEMYEWWELSRTQSIYFHDFAGYSYEVVIVKFDPTRKRTLRNPRDFTNAPYWYWTYDMSMEVLTFIDGPQKDADIEP